MGTGGKPEGGAFMQVKTNIMAGITRGSPKYHIFVPYS
jgi:hypothetical protein